MLFDEALTESRRGPVFLDLRCTFGPKSDTTMKYTTPPAFKHSHYSIPTSSVGISCYFGHFESKIAAKPTFSFGFEHIFLSYPVFWSEVHFVTVCLHADYYATLQQENAKFGC